MPILNTDEVMRYLVARGFLSSAEQELVMSRWSVDTDGPLMQFLGREKLLPQEVVDDLIELIGNNILEGHEPKLPGLMLLNLVGRGGRGRVYRAWQPSLKRVIAVKILSRALAENREYIQRFLREARVASKVQHRYIVRAYDINKHQGNVYMVMDYIPGLSLGQILRDRIKLDVADLLEISRMTAEALSYTARVGLVHRDIKPDNILIDLNGRVKICDLGLARPAGTSDLTAPTVAQGTPAYMAPESALTSDLDAQADVYSLGVTMYRMLLGKVPFENSDPVEVLRMHVEEAPRGLDASAPLQKLILRMLEKDPAKRISVMELPKTIAGLQHSLPTLKKARTWDLIPNGEPAADHSDPELHLDEGHDPEPEAPPLAAPVVFPANQTKSDRIGRKYPGAGILSLSLALIVCVIYILVMSFKEPPAEPEDPRIKEFQQQVTDLEQDKNSLSYARKKLAQDMQMAAQHLQLENEENQRLSELEPERDSVNELEQEMNKLDKTLDLKNLPVDRK
ncbi:MAG: serine/threonine protein kinase [Planctomycetes bacterium]|nr:serine/threonine protein kinase [Planctomycetota bacterium]